MNVLRSALYAIWLFVGSTILAILYLPTLILPRGAIRAGIRFWGFYLRFGLKLIWIHGVLLLVPAAQRSKHECSTGSFY